MERKPDSPEKPKRRKRPASPPLWIRLSVALLSPFLFLVIIELGLTLAGYGLPRKFFFRYSQANEPLYLTNRHYCEHFVPKELSRAPEAVTLAKKGPRTIRVFVLGGSAAFGDPDPAYGFCRQLQTLLDEHATETSFEVVNAAVTSMNSHVARRIAQDCASHEPDVFIVFMGNNEIVGPYGPPTLPKTLYASRAFINLSITAKKETRLGQLIDKGIQRLRTAGRPRKKWQGMEAFLASQIAYDDEKLQICYRHFADNLRDIVCAAHAQGTKTILCTVPTNIRSCAPFGSAHTAGLSRDQLAQWDQHFNKGRELQRSGTFELALAEYQSAWQIDDDYADLAFCLGTCLKALGQNERARDMFVRARDLDTLRFRADTPIDAAIRRAGQTLGDRGATCLDLNGWLEARTEDGLLGDSLLVDHVHLNFRGNFLAALAAMETLRGLFPRAGLREPWRDETELLNLCRQRLVFDDREVYRLAMVMYQRKTLPPFKGQLDHDMEMEGIRQSLFKVYRMVSRRSSEEAPFVEALELAPYDPYLMARYGRFLLAQGRLGDAIRLYEKVLESQPYNVTARAELAKTMALGGMSQQAIDVLMSDEAPYRCDRKQALLLLGVHYAQSGRLAQASEVYQELSRIDPENLDVLINQAAAASYAGQMDVMKQSLDKAIAIAPDSTQVMVNMGNYYARDNQPAEARNWFAKAVAADPQDHMGHIGLGIQSIRLGEYDKGIEHITEAVRLKPDLFQGYQILTAVYAELGQVDKARECAELRDLFQPQPGQ